MICCTRVGDESLRFLCYRYRIYKVRRNIVVTNFYSITAYRTTPHYVRKCCVFLVSISFAVATFAIVVQIPARPMILAIGDWFVVFIFALCVWFTSLVFAVAAPLV